MKILFLLASRYVYEQPFTRVAKELEARGHTCSLVSMYADASQAEDFPSLELYKPKAQAPFAQKCFFLVRLLRNRATMRRYLSKEAPDVVVTGGDITDINGRVFHDLAAMLSCPVVIIPVTVPGRSVRTTLSRRLTFLHAVLEPVLMLAGLRKAATFNGWVLGSYALRASIAVPDRATADELASLGIDRRRMAVTGNPAHDAFFSLKNRRVAADGVKIMYCTEMIQDIYSPDYLQRINGLLLCAFNRLSGNHTVVIRLHPREPAEAEQHYRALFSGPRFLVTREGGLVEMLSNACLVIAHYSVVLNDAALMGVPVLSIRLFNDLAPVRFGRVDESVHALREESVGALMDKLLAGRETRAKQRETISRWQGESGILFDGRCAARCADLIESAAKGRG